MSANVDSGKPSRRPWLLRGTVTALVVTGAAVATIFALQRPERPTKDDAPIKAEGASDAPSSSEYTRVALDESGMLLIDRQYFVPQIKDPTSLESIRDAWLSAGPRAVDHLQS